MIFSAGDLQPTQQAIQMVDDKLEEITNRKIGINQAIDKTKIKLSAVKENLYVELRDKALSTTAEQLNLNLDEDKTIVYGVVMDWDIDNAVVAIIAFQSGVASMYLSTGQIYIGGYGHESIKIAARTLVNEGQNYVPKAKMTYYTKELRKQCLSFYLLTNKYTFTKQVTLESLANNETEWRKLFDLGNNVVTEYRVIVDKENRD